MTTPPPQRQIRIAEPSVKSLLIEMRVNGTPLGVGTGFAATSPRGPVLVTNRHNVTGRHQQTSAPLSRSGAVPDEIWIIHNRANQLGQWLFRDEPLYANGQPLWIEHPTLGAQADFIALPLTQLGDVQLYLYSLGAGDPSIIVAPGEIVSVVGFPFGLTAGGSLEEVAPIILKAEQIVIPDEVVDTVHEALLGVIEAKADIESLMELHRQNRVSHVAPYGTQPPKAR